MHIASSDRPVALYSLDTIISVGYRAILGRERSVVTKHLNIA
jgi:hypothetical protein